MRHALVTIGVMEHSGHGAAQSPARRLSRPLMAAVVAGTAVLTAVSVVLVANTALGPAPATTWPPRPPDAQTSRVLPLVAPGPGSGGYAFTHVREDGSPVVYDPCRPIHYVINDTRAPAGSRTLVRQQFEELERLTGLRFVYDGRTDEVARPGRAAVNKDLYGNRWAPVLVNWGTAADEEGLAGSTVGVTRNTRVEKAPGTMRLVTGVLVLDLDDLPASLTTHKQREFTRTVVRHELGHIVGLDHVADPSVLMFEAKTNLRTYTAADRRGLAIAGAGDCFHDDPK